MASCSKLPVGSGTATARPAASLHPAPSSSSPSSIHRRGRVRPRVIEPALAAAATCARTLGARDVSCILHAASGARRGGQKVANSGVGLKRVFRFAVPARILSRLCCTVAFILLRVCMFREMPLYASRAQHTSCAKAFARQRAGVPIARELRAPLPSRRARTRESRKKRKKNGEMPIFWKMYMNMCASGRCLRYAFCWLLKEEQGRQETAILEYVLFQGSSLSL